MDKDRPVGGQVMTVLGPVPSGSLGLCLPHEHLLIELRPFVEYADSARRKRQLEPVRLANLGWVRQYWTHSADNLRLVDERLAARELRRFRAAGGGTVVDLTLPGIGRDPEALARISRASGVSIVMGCGAYVGWSHPDDVRRASVDQLVEAWLGEVVDGVAGTGIRPGIIGEIGCSWPLESGEDRALRAAAAVQRRSGLAVTVHPGRNRAAPAQILDILGEAGADLQRVVVAHIERTVPDLDGLISVMERGCLVAFDCFGLETSYYPVPGITDIDMPSDAQRLDRIRGLLDAGFGRRILVAHDICTKHRLARYGGHGYDHLPANVIPWMQARGFTASEIRALVVDNPASILAIAEPVGSA